METNQGRNEFVVVLVVVIAAIFVVAVKAL
jgi:hypothetical protein